MQARNTALPARCSLPPMSARSISLCSCLNAPSPQEVLAAVALVHELLERAAVGRGGGVGTAHMRWLPDACCCKAIIRAIQFLKCTAREPIRAIGPTVSLPWLVGGALLAAATPPTMGHARLTSSAALGLLTARHPHLTPLNHTAHLPSPPRSTMSRNRASSSSGGSHSRAKSAVRRPARMHNM